MSVRRRNTHTWLTVGIWWAAVVAAQDVPLASG
jgi:hypothetical protein